MRVLNVTRIAQNLGVVAQAMGLKLGWFRGGIPLRAKPKR